jgi:hypothetical protein
MLKMKLIYSYAFLTLVLPPVFSEISIQLSPSMKQVGEIKETLIDTKASIQEASVHRGLFIEPASPYLWIASPGEDLRVRLFTDKALTQDRLRLTIWDWCATPIDVRELRTPIDEWLRFSFKVNGVFLITLDAFDTDNHWKSRLVRTVACLPDGRQQIKSWKKNNDYFLGSCFFPMRYGKWNDYFWPDLSSNAALNKTVDLAARAGLQVLRVDYDRDHPFDFSGLDPIVDVITNFGLSANFKIPAKPEFCYGKSNQEWVDAVYALALKHGRSATLFEIGNEPAFSNYFPGTREEYQQLLFQG